MSDMAKADGGEILRALPGDEARQIMWRFADRYDLQMLVQAVREVARGPVARLVAAGARNSHDWTEEKARLLEAFDTSGVTSMFLEPEQGGFIAGPKNFAMALAAYELSWVDAGAATCSLAGNLALAPIHERGTDEQREFYMRVSAPGATGGEVWRGAFALTEPLPYVGVETGMLGGKVRVEEWPEGGEPILRVDKRGRFITNMGFANFVTAAVESDDPRIKGSCMVILHRDDPGTYDRGTATKKLVHQLSSTTDPVFSLRVPAGRIIGGYTVKEGVIVPNHSHGEVIEAVFKRTRVTVGLMTSAKLLSAVEPVIRYQRGRFRGGDIAPPGSPRYEMGLQQKEDVLLRLVDIWAAGEAASSLGFETARLFDALDPLEKRKEAILAARGVRGGRAEFKALKEVRPAAIEWIRLESMPEGARDAARHAELGADELVRYVVADSLANVLCPACKLWNTGHGATVMREAVSLMGGYGITEDCPGFLGQKWMDSQLEATYEGPESVQRRQLSLTMIDEVFLAHYDSMKSEMRRVAATHPGTGACTLATAMELWRWTLDHLQDARDANGDKLYHGSRQGVTFPLADALCWILATRQQILDVLELERGGAAAGIDGLQGLLAFFTDMAHVHAAAAAGEVGRICAELVFGYNRHPAWDAEGCASCYCAEELEEMESLMPGISGEARGRGDVLDAGGARPTKAGPCARFDGAEAFLRLRAKLDGCLAGSRLAKDRAAEALTRVMIPEALDYPR